VQSIVLTSSILIVASLTAVGQDSMDAQFQQLSERFIGEFTRLSPVSSTELGDHRFDSQLDQVSSEQRGIEADFYRRYLAELGKFDRDRLSRQSQVDHALLEHALNKWLWSQETLQEWAWNPLVYTRLAGGSIYGLMAREFAPLERRLSHAADRLEQFPRLLAQVRETLVPKRVPPVHAETTAKQNPGVLRIIDHMVEPHLASLPVELKQRLTRSIRMARDAVSEHQKWIESTLVPKAAGNFRIGPKLYDQKLQFTLHSPMSRDQIRARADSELRRVRLEMYEISKGVYTKGYPLTEFPDDPTPAYRQAIIRACLELAYADVPPRDAIVEAAKSSLKTTTDFVREHELITVPDDPLEIILMPEFQRGVSAAYCDSPGALDVGQKTFYAVAPLPTDWTDRQVDSFLREYNTRSLHNLTIHEAMPGHFTQLARANRFPSQLRAVLQSGVFVEGWACYTEQVMVDAGFMDNDPLMRLIMLKWYLRSIVNSQIDQAIHVDGISRDEAMRMMVEDGFQEEREAAGKWVRAQLTSVQLSTYFVGLQEHLDMRRAAETEWNDDFTLKRYHDAVTEHGSPPVRFVRALILNRKIPR